MYAYASTTVGSRSIPKFPFLYAATIVLALWDGTGFVQAFSTFTHNGKHRKIGRQSQSSAAKREYDQVRNMSSDDNFDPFATSPHDYGRDGGDRPFERDTSLGGAQSSTTSVKKPFGIDYYSSLNKPGQQSLSSSEVPSNVIPAETFDPRISPHQYSTKKTLIDDATSTGRPGDLASPGRRRRKVGILLMDHGSKNPAANQRLHDLAKIYHQQLQFHNNQNDDDDTSSTPVVEMIVTAAHMEIATPTIPEGLEWLLSQQVDEIICHPYFLSPGRHVTQDIPRIVQQAIIDLKIDSSIAVRTTEPVGSNTLLMMGAIHALVKEHSQVLREASYSSNGSA